MQDIKYVCPGCGFEAREPGICPKCKERMIATCSACGNPVVGEHIRA